MLQLADMTFTREMTHECCSQSQYLFTIIHATAEDDEGHVYEEEHEKEGVQDAKAGRVEGRGRRLVLSTPQPHANPAFFLTTVFF